nr:hypothetical protein [Tanacetum cinerariifolium]
MAPFSAKGQNCSFPGDMSPGNVARDKSAESTTGPRRVYSRAVAAETQPKMLPGPTTVTIEVRISPSTPCTLRLHRQRQTKAQFGRQGSGHAEYPRQDPKPLLIGNHGYERPRPDPV